MNSSYLNTKECAEMLRKSPKTIRRWITVGIKGKRLAATKVVLDWRINQSTLDKFLWDIQNITTGDI